jgi:hypothetical protein
MTLAFIEDAERWRTAAENDDEEPGAHANRTRDAVIASGTAALAPLVSIDDLFAPQGEAAFLVPGLGISPGAPTGFFGQGYVGKTIVAQSVAMAVALGQRLWGVYATRRGRVLHLDHEQGLRITATRYQRLAKANGVWADDFRDWLDVAIHPRLNLTTSGAEDHYARLFDGRALAIVDALKGATPGVDENSSEMRDYMGVLSRASERTGCAVLLLHHAGKTIVGGDRPRKESGRGSSAIFDECQSVFVLTAGKGEPVRVSHEKDRELGSLLDDFGMQVEDVEIDGDRRGGLRVVHLEAAQINAAPTGAAPRAQSQARDRILAYLSTTGGTHCGSKGALAGAIGMKRVDAFDALSTLEADGSIAITGGRGARFIKAVGAVAPSDATVEDDA